MHMFFAGPFSNAMVTFRCLTDNTHKHVMQLLCSCSMYADSVINKDGERDPPNTTCYEWLLWNSSITTQQHTTTVLQPFVQDYVGEPVPEETLTHPPSWSSPNLYQLLPSTMIHSILLVQTVCFTIFLHNLCPYPLWSTSWSGALHLIFHTYLHPISVFFSQHMPMPSQPVWL